MKVLILLSVVAVALAKECAENQHYESCGTACPLTCNNYKNPPKFCILMCNPGCHCDEGYVKTEDGSCVIPEECPAKAEPVQKTCLAKPDAGMCLAYIPMWYYDVKAEKCFEFVYGGCQGNGNRYQTEKECMEHCKDIKMRKSDAVGACDLPAETGVCRGYFPRYYFDRTTGECKTFVYGGCGGNENNFESEDECKSTCGVQKSNSACSLPAVTGPCRAYFRRFYFNTKTGACEEFVYGGCQGNSNNFKTKEDCQSVCA